MTRYSPRAGIAALVAAAALTFGLLTLSVDNAPSVLAQASSKAPEGFERGDELSDDDLKGKTIEIKAGIKAGDRYFYGYDFSGSSSVSKGEVAAQSKSTTQAVVTVNINSSTESTKFKLNGEYRQILMRQEIDGDRIELVAVDGEKGMSSLLRNGVPVEPDKFPRLPSKDTLKNNLKNSAFFARLNDNLGLEQPALAVNMPTSATSTYDPWSLPQRVLNPLPALRLAFAGFADREFAAIGESITLESGLAIDSATGVAHPYRITLKLTKVYGIKQTSKATNADGTVGTEDVTETILTVADCEVEATPINESGTVGTATVKLPAMKGSAQLDLRRGLVSLMDIQGSYANAAGSDVTVRGDLRLRVALVSDPVVQ